MLVLFVVILGIAWSRGDGGCVGVGGVCDGGGGGGGGGVDGRRRGGGRGHGRVVVCSGGVGSGGGGHCVEGRVIFVVLCC